MAMVLATFRRAWPGLTRPGHTKRKPGGKGKDEIASFGSFFVFQKMGSVFVCVFLFWGGTGPSGPVFLCVVFRGVPDPSASKVDGDCLSNN